MSERKPYVGITGITSGEQAKVAANTFEKYFPKNAAHTGMTGYLVSLDNLQNPDFENDKYPPLNTLAEMLTITNETALNTIHYRTPDKRNLADQIIQVFENDDIYKNGLCRTVQLNMRWPNKEELEKIKEKMPDLNVILQVGPSILHQQDRFEIATQIKDYGNLIDYVLIDPSGGVGKEADPDFYSSIYRPINHNAPNKAIILAGGLNNHNVLPKLQEFEYSLDTKDFGIDAEQGLRDSKDNSQNTILSNEKIQQYIEKAAEFYLKQEK